MREAKGFDDWERTLALGEIIAAVRAYFGKGKPPMIRLMKLNPYGKNDNRIKKQTTTLDPDVAEKVFDAISVEETDDPFA